MIPASLRTAVTHPTSMTRHPRPNYLRTHRKRASLSQRHIAMLLGARSGTKISRYEHYSRIPDLMTVFALEIIYGIPARDLFAGMYDEARRTTLRRAANAIRGPDPTLASFARRILDPSARPPTKQPTPFS